MKLTKIAAMGIVAATVFAPMSAFAAFCTNEGPNGGYTIVEDNGVSKLVIDVDAQARLDKQRLREVGVVAERTERWNGCIRAFVTAADGAQSMEFYDPANLRRVQ